MPSPDTERKTLPRGLSLLGWIGLVGTALLSLRLFYEQTVLTWEAGWQMVGFSLAHTNPALLLLGLLAVVCGHVFFAALLVMVVVDKVHKRSVLRPNLTLVFTLAIVTGSLYVPYAGWMTLLVKLWGPGQHGNSYLSFAAAEHHPYLVKTLINSGVPVDTPYGGYTALNAACVQKDLQIARYLLSRGSELSRAPDCEWLHELTGKPRPIQVPGTSVDVRE
jgi:hypothetical protein